MRTDVNYCTNNNVGQQGAYKAMKVGTAPSHLTFDYHYSPDNNEIGDKDQFDVQFGGVPLLSFTAGTKNDGKWHTFSYQIPGGQLGTLQTFYASFWCKDNNFNNGYGASIDNIHVACDPAPIHCIAQLDGTACDDGNSCTLGDTCKTFVCKPGPVDVCDDANICTNDSCDPLLGCIQTNNTIACTDGNACTNPDVCLAGACVPGTADYLRLKWSRHSIREHVLDADALARQAQQVDAILTCRHVAVAVVVAERLCQHFNALVLDVDDPIFRNASRGVHGRLCCAVLL